MVQLRQEPALLHDLLDQACVRPVVLGEKDVQAMGELIHAEAPIRR